MVSCHIITYNQKDFIRQCLDGVLMQNTNFTYEIIIGDDLSTDGTREILIDYAKKYPDKICLNLRNKRGEGVPGKQNFLTTLYLCKGKYISLCDGDDYWTDPHKLQKQVDFLEANDDFALSFHNAKIINERGPNHSIEKYSDYDWNCMDVNRDEYSLSDLLRATLCPTASVVFRKPENFSLPAWFGSMPFGDMPLFILVTGQKRIKFFNETWSAYRRHAGSESAQADRGDVYTRGKISMYMYLYDGLPEKQKAGIPELLKKYINDLPGIMYLHPPERQFVRKLIPLFYYARVAWFYVNKFQTKSGS